MAIDAVRMLAFSSGDDLRLIAWDLRVGCLVAESRLVDDVTCAAALAPGDVGLGSRGGGLTILSMIGAASAIPPTSSR